jgi:PAS domain S-box-containing protein
MEFATDRGPPQSVDLTAHRVIEQVRDYAMVLFDRHGRAASWNEGVRAILGWEHDEWLGQPLRAIFTSEDAAAGAAEQELRQAAETGRADDHRWLQRKNGERFFAAGSSTRIVDHAGRLLGFLKVLRDETAWMRAAEERDRLLASERAAHHTVERQAAVLNAALEAIPDGLYIGHAGGITQCNAPALAMLGATSLQDLQDGIAEMGRKFRVRRERHGPPVEPDELPFARALKGEQAVLETWATKPSGEDVFIRGTAAPIVVEGEIVGAVALNSDLTEHLQLQQKRHELSQVQTVLSERDEQFRALVKGVRDYAIFTVDLEGKISSWHEGAAMMKGYTAEEAIGMPFANLFVPEQRAAGRPEHEMEVAARTGEYKGEGVRLRKNGQIFEAAVVLTALHGPAGELLGYLKLTQDITERKHQEREREELLRNAQAARDDAERASRSKDEFLATISHELRTPLGAILGWAHVLERGMSDPDGVKQGLAAITRNARVQVQLIEDLLDMNRIESGQLRLDVQPVELTGVIGGAIEAITPAATNKRIGVRTVLEAATGIVMGDPSRLQQIVWNLLSNAVKFTPSGGRITVSLTRVGHTLEISVADTGQGIRPDFLPRVFDRFQQQDATTTRRYGGLGIGLSIVQQLARLHGGNVRAESAGTGHGATFTVSLPAFRAPPAVPTPGGEAPLVAAGDDAGRAGQRLEGVSVLVIDDEPDGRAIAAQVLRSAGAKVFAAGSAQEGFAAVRAHRPKVVLCDIGMPVHDGYEFVRWLRNLGPEEGGKTPAVAFTAYARPEDRQRALAAGYQSHLVKPVEPGGLVLAVASLADLPVGG